MDRAEALAKPHHLDFRRQDSALAPLVDAPRRYKVGVKLNRLGLIRR
jgi:hypothetical protein